MNSLPVTSRQKRLMKGDVEVRDKYYEWGALLIVGGLNWIISLRSAHSMPGIFWPLEIERCLLSRDGMRFSLLLLFWLILQRVSSKEGDVRFQNKRLYYSSQAVFQVSFTLLT